MTVSLSDKTYKLSSGHTIPAIGLGTWLLENDESQEGVAASVKCAIDNGYRLIDGAAVYANEIGVGKGIRSSGIDRKDLFVVSKLWNNSHVPETVEPAIDSSLKDLGLSYVDLYLMHWPIAFKQGDDKFPSDANGNVIWDKDVPIEETWKAMEKLVESGKAKSIGVSNFNIDQLNRILAIAKIKPVVNEIEAHPFLQQPELFEFMQKHDIVPIAYSSLNNSSYKGPHPMVVNDPAIADIAKKLGRTSGDVILSYLVQKGYVVIPKSKTPSRIAANRALSELPKDVFDTLAKLDEGRRYCSPPWTYDLFK